MPSISVTNPELITSIDLGTATPKLGGTVDLNNFKIFTAVEANAQDLEGFQNYDHLTSLTRVDLAQNKLVGDIPVFSNNPSCTSIRLNENNFDGNLPSTLPLGIKRFYAGKNNISTSSVIPNLKSYTDLVEFKIGFQSDDFGVNANATSPKRSGASALGNTATSDPDITGSIPLSIRRFFVNGTNLSPLSKLQLLTQFYDTFKDQAANYVRVTAAADGLTYDGSTNSKTPTINVGGANETNFTGTYSDSTSLLGKHSAVTVGTAKNKLGPYNASTNPTGVGFNLVGF